MMRSAAIKACHATNQAQTTKTGAPGAIFCERSAAISGTVSPAIDSIWPQFSVAMIDSANIWKLRGGSIRATAVRYCNHGRRQNNHNGWIYGYLHRGSGWDKLEVSVTPCIRGRRAQRGNYAEGLTVTLNAIVGRFVIHIKQALYVRFLDIVLRNLQH